MVLSHLRNRLGTVTGRTDRGAVSAELAVAMPLLLFLITLIVQAGVYLHAGHIARAAANRAADAAAAYQASASDGQQAGERTLASIGHAVLVNPTVTVTRTATEVRAEVTGTAETVLPGVSWAVRAVVVRPVERFVTGGTEP